MELVPNGGSKISLGFPGSSVGKESACSAGDLGSIPGLGRSSGGRHGNPLQYPCLENPKGQRSLAGYSLWGHKALDTADCLSTQQKVGIFLLRILPKCHPSCRETSRVTLVFQVILVLLEDVIVPVVSHTLKHGVVFQ